MTFLRIIYKLFFTSSSYSNMLISNTILLLFYSSVLMNSFNFQWILMGIVCWNSWEYIYHRYIMHYTNIGKLQYYLHGHHHAHPNKSSIHIPLFQYWVLYPFYYLLKYVFLLTHNQNINYTIGHICALIVFENLHKEIHNPYWIVDKNCGFRVSHMYHHNVNKNKAYCFTCPLFDILFGTFPDDVLNYNILAFVPIPILSYVYGTNLKIPKNNHKTLLIGGGGLMFWYYIGVISKKLKNDANYIDNFHTIVGVSCGSLVGCLVVSKCDIETIKNDAIQLVNTLQLNNLSIFNCLHIIRDFYKKHLPPNAYILCSNKLHIQSISLYKGEVVCFNMFTSNDDLIDKLFKACHIPFMSNTITNDGYIDRCINRCKEGCCDSKNTEIISIPYLSLDMFRVPDEKYINDNYLIGFNKTDNLIIKMI